MKKFLSLLYPDSSCPLAGAAEPPDLGYNLSYLRVHSLADATPQLQSALAVNHSCVLDLRYATASDESIAALRTALAAHPSDSPLFILIGPATPSNVLGAIDPPAHGSFITLGIAGSQPAPRIMVRTDAETDRLAYDAFDHGTPLADLISGKIDKDRYDEATLVHEFKSGNPEPEPPLSPDPTKAKDSVDADKSNLQPGRAAQGSGFAARAESPSGLASLPALI